MAEATDCAAERKKQSTVAEPIVDGQGMRRPARAVELLNTIGENETMGAERNSLEN